MKIVSEIIAANFKIIASEFENADNKLRGGIVTLRFLSRKGSLQCS